MTRDTKNSCIFSQVSTRLLTLLGRTSKANPAKTDPSRWTQNRASKLCPLAPRAIKPWRHQPPTIGRRRDPEPQPRTSSAAKASSLWRARVNALPSARPMPDPHFSTSRSPCTPHLHFRSLTLPAPSHSSRPVHNTSPPRHCRTPPPLRVANTTGGNSATAAGDADAAAAAAAATAAAELREVSARAAVPEPCEPGRVNAGRSSSARLAGTPLQ